MEFNRIIKLLRKERGITQKQAAEDLGVSQALLSHYEKGIRECGLDFVVRVADYYNVSCDYLLGRSAERNGMMLSAEDLPNPEKMKDNVYHGSVLPTMNKKLISNSLNVLYAKIGQCHSKALTTEVSAYLMMAVAKMFRMLYSAEPHNASSMFSIEPHRWHGYSDAVMRMAEANVEALLDGQDVNAVSIHSVRDACAYVPQDNFLFSDTISGNISFAFDDENQEAIEDAAMMSDVHDNIAEFKEGYRTVLGERGVTVSGGQKQRISIARALMKHAPILILDDSVSAVDTKTERTILDNLKKREGLTTILIAHRISTVEQMDKIVFVEDGEVHAVGKHEDLYRTCTAYRKMVDLQKLEEEAGEE